MPTLVATAGATDANSYCTLDEAELYFETRLHADDWNDATDDDKEFALMWATRLLDNLCAWDGAKVTDTQALRWPRSYIYDPDYDLVDSTTIPNFLKNATAEYALNLIGSDYTQPFNPDLIGFDRLVVGPIEATMSTSGGQQKKSMVPDSVWILVRQYCQRVGARTKRLVRI